MQAVRPSSVCLEIVKTFEGFNAQPMALGDRRWLVGYGHVREGAPGSPIDEAEAEFVLKEDLEEISQVLRAGAPEGLTQPQFDALAAFGFSIGAEALKRSDVLALVKTGDILSAADGLERWRDVGERPELRQAMAARRAAEKALLLSEEPQRPAPSALARPAQVAEDQTVAQLRAILASNPATASALAPPPPPAANDDEEEPAHSAAPAPPAEPQSAPAAAPRPQPTDSLALAALGVLGLFLITMGVTGADEDRGMSYLIFAGPGAVAVAMSVYYWLKKTVESL